MATFVSRKTLMLTAGLVLCSATYQRDQELDLDYRGSVGGGVGRWLLHSNRRALSALGGVLLVRERYEGESAENEVEGLLMVQYAGYQYVGRDVDVNVTYKVLPSLSDSGRLRGELDADVSIETVKNFFVGLSGYDTFDSRPPQADLAQHDYGVTFSLRWKF
jgi:Protein of unknown function, DUF481